MKNYDENALDEFYSADNSLFVYFCIYTTPQTGRRSKYIDPIITTLVNQSKAQISDINSFQVIPHGIAVVLADPTNKIFKFCTENSKMHIMIGLKILTFYISLTPKNPYGLFDIPQIPLSDLQTPILTPVTQVHIQTPTITNYTSTPTTTPTTPPSTISLPKPLITQSPSPQPSKRSPPKQPPVIIPTARPPPKPPPTILMIITIKHNPKWTITKARNDHHRQT